MPKVNREGEEEMFIVENCSDQLLIVLGRQKRAYKETKAVFGPLGQKIEEAEGRVRGLLEVCFHFLFRHFFSCLWFFSLTFPLISSPPSPRSSFPLFGFGESKI